MAGCWASRPTSVLACRPANTPITLVSNASTSARPSPCESPPANRYWWQPSQSTGHDHADRCRADATTAASSWPWRWSSPLIVFVGFAPTYYLRAFYHADPLPSVFRIHGLVFTAWVVLFVVQTALVSARRTDIHRRLGVVGARWRS